MPEEPKVTELNEEENNNENTNEEEKGTEKEEESKQSVVEKIDGMVEDFVNPDPDKTEGAEVPESFSTAAIKAGWTEEAIDGFCDGYSNEELLEMIPLLTTENSVETEKTSDKTDKSKTEEKNSQDDGRLEKALERIAALEESQDVDNEERSKREQANLIRRASQIFDDKSKEFEVFGMTDKLPAFPDGRLIPTSPQLKARIEVWDLAASLQKTGMDFEDAMSTSLNAYKGKNLSNDVKRNIIKDLKKNEKKLSGKRTSHESSKNIISGVDVIREVVRRAGRNIN